MQESIKRYRQAKAIQMLNNFKKEFKKECEEAKVLIKKLCQVVNKQNN